LFTKTKILENFIIMQPSTSSASNNLIVDFPFAKGSSGIKSVRFASHCDGVFIAKTSPQERVQRWYSREQQKMARDAMRCSYLLGYRVSGGSKAEDTLSSKEFALLCIGLDHLIARDVSQRWESIKRSRKNHARLVLDEQNRQRSLNFNCPENLARVSAKDSASTRKRSHWIAKITAPIA
jgi:hypothetical protein